jgi:hypothetical protein
MLPMKHADFFCIICVFFYFKILLFDYEGSTVICVEISNLAVSL